MELIASQEEQLWHQQEDAMYECDSPTQIMEGRKDTAIKTVLPPPPPPPADLKQDPSHNDDIAQWMGLNDWSVQHMDLCLNNFSV